LNLPEYDATLPIADTAFQELITPVTENPLKIGIIGSRSYSNRDRMIKVIGLTLERAKALGREIVIVSGGQPKGGDGLAKDLALNHFHLSYHEFAPRHYQWNQYCIPMKEEYSKPYNIKYYLDRNIEIAKYSDYIFAFVCRDMSSKGTMDTVQKAISWLGPDKVVVFTD